MKINRHKKLERILNFYRNNWGFRSPYHILLDGTFAAAAIKSKLDIREQLAAYLKDEIVLSTTVCVVTELDKLGLQLYAASLVIKQFPVRKCGHETNPISASKCLLSMVQNGNQHHFMIATQDSELSQTVRTIPQVPLVYISRNGVFLEKVSEASRKEVESEARSTATAAQPTQLDTVKELKWRLGLEAKPTEGKRKKKKPKGPNPLSCRKRKAKQRPSKAH